MEDLLNDNSKIVNLLQIIFKSNIVIYLRTELNEYSGQIQKIEFDEFIYHTRFKIPKLTPPITFNFNYLNKYYYFDAELVKAEKSQSYFKIPQLIYLHYKRKSTRYNTEKSDMYADIKIVQIPESPTIQFIKNKSQLTGIKNKIYSELQEDVPNVNHLMHLILKEITQFSMVDMVKIIIPVKDENIYTRILRAWNKPLLVQVTQEKESYNVNPYPDEAVTFLEYLKLLKEKKTPEDKISEFISNLMVQFKKEEIYSVLYTPIFVSSLMPGYIIAYNTTESSRKIELPIIKHLKDRAEIIHEALLKRRLNSLTEHELKVKVVDISPNGIGFRLIDPLLISSFIKGMKLKISLPLDDKICSFFGVIKSKRKREDGTYLGIEIREIVESNRAILYNYIESNLKIPKVE
ncbi:MAG: PilZ domain-containing protein [Spirochaetes bacterium]|nr:PilZ domain-containing protein [Spirochaetota bacterium]